MVYKLEGYPKKIFNDRYVYVEGETWEEACMRWARQTASCEKPDKIKKYEEKFYNHLVKNYFVPGGRICYNSGRPNPQLLNCFVLGHELDSKEGWGNISREMIITSMTGGGCGVDFSDVRPRGAEISGQKGECPGPVELMKLVNYNGKPVRAGGARRVALMFSLDLDHSDIMEFLNAKLEQGQLDLANVSVRSKKTKAFVKAVREDLDWECSWKGKYKKTFKARDIWNIITKNAYDCAEPGFLNMELIESESNIYYIEPIVTTNPCFAKDTKIVTKNGLEPIKNLVNKKVDIWNGDNWQSIDNFRITGKNQQLLKILLHDGSELRVTPEHTMILNDNTRVKAKQLEVGQKLAIGNTITNGQLKASAAYLKGFLVGDGTVAKDKPLLWLYEPKYLCENRLIQSAEEIQPTNNYNNITEQVLFFSSEDTVHKRKCMKGLTSRKNELLDWCRENKKSIPDEVFQWDYQSKCNFIAGVMDSDGSASDTKNGFMYQIWSINKKWLQDFQTLLKTIGVYSKLSVGKNACLKDFNDGYGEYKSKDSYRLTISQESSITLSQQVKFERLVSFAQKTTAYRIKPKFNKIVSIEFDEIADEVYCCTVEGSHSLSVGVGVHTGQCGEIAMSSYDACCLGHLVLFRFVENGELQWDKIASTVRMGVRFLDNVLSVNTYPLEEMKEKSNRLRRIGLGTTGLADMLALLGLKYGSDESLKFIDKLYRFISKIAYESSVMLAIEKGPFPACKPELHVKSGFMKRMPKKIKDLVLEHGIRNCAVLTQAPTGTVSILSGNCSSGIEPMFAPAYERRFWEGEVRKTELVFHPLFKQFMEEGKDVSHFVSSRELSVRNHMEVQATVQKHVDNAVSKTINIPEDYPLEEVSDLWLEYMDKLKGTTFYRENTRGYVDEDGKLHEPPLVAIPLDEAIKKFKDGDESSDKTIEDCASGSCEI